LRKCFDNINRIKFEEVDEHTQKVVAMISAEPENMPEEVQFAVPVEIGPGDKVENWLKAIEETMVSSLRTIGL